MKRNVIFLILSKFSETDETNFQMCQLLINSHKLNTKLVEKFVDFI